MSYIRVATVLYVVMDGEDGDGVIGSLDDVLERLLPPYLFTVLADQEADLPALPYRLVVEDDEAPLAEESTP